MNPTKMLFVAAIGFSAAACSTYTTTRTQTAAGPGPIILTTSEQACLDYGFASGTVGYDRCVTREHEARMRGRVVAGYAESNLTADARSACYSYGLEPGSVRYDRCVGRELDARRYRADAAAAVVYTPAPAYAPATSYTTVYTPAYAPAPSYPAPGYSSSGYVESRNDPPVGVQSFKDEFGFRYDGQGNRLDRNGNIISPQSTQP